MIIITKRAFVDVRNYTVWKPKYWNTAFFAKNGGSMLCRQAKLLFKLPTGQGVFWAFGKSWVQ